jgi:nucleoside-diphosphate-sugar epimerase
MCLPLRSLVADLSKADQARRVCEGVDVVVHAAAIHPWKPYTSDQYLDWNIKATYNVLAAAAEVGVKRVIYTSSIAAMGYKVNSPSELPFDENKPCRPEEDLYGITKHVGEQFCHMLGAKRGLKYVILRPGYFVPRDEMDPALGLMYLEGRVHPGDVVQAHVQAVAKSGASGAINEAFVITSETPFRREDAEELKSSPVTAVTRYFPRAAELFSDPAVKPRPIQRWYSIEKAKRLLGWQPKVSFGNWLDRYLASRST